MGNDPTGFWALVVYSAIGACGLIVGLTWLSELAQKRLRRACTRRSQERERVSEPYRFYRH